MRRAYIAAALRTAVAPRGGAFAQLEAWELAAPLFAAVLADGGIAADRVDEVILGNALAGGGNVARLAALAARLPERVPALTIDRQCTSGLDAIKLAAHLVEAGAAEIVIAGGVESWSRSALRAHRPRTPGGSPEFYDAPPFSPWPARDPDMAAAAAALAQQAQVPRGAQDGYAVESHRKAMAARAVLEAEIRVLERAPLSGDAFTRSLSAAVCGRAPVVAGHGAFALDAATVAVEADGAALVLVVSEQVARGLSGLKVRIVGASARGAAPEQPALAMGPAVEELLAKARIAASDLDCVELMEAFAVQAMVNIASLGLVPATVNIGGGALARGHPVGASGAILAVRLYHELRNASRPATGLAAIAAAGGLATAMLLRSDDSI